MAGFFTVEEAPQQHQVFINFYGEELLCEFISNLVMALESNNINFFIDNKKDRGEKVEVAALKRIEESRIALVIISMRYTESPRCMEELAKIKDCVKKGKLVAIPIFYKVDSSTVASLKGYFGGDVFMDLVETDATKKTEWKYALYWISHIKGSITVSTMSSEGDIIKEIVKNVEEKMSNIPSKRSQNVIKEIVEEFEKLVKKIPSEGSQNAYVEKSAGEEAPTVEKRSPQHPEAGFVSHLFSFMESQGDGMDGIVELLQKLQKYKNCKPPQIQVFISFRGEELRSNFVSYLVDALQRSEINVFIDNNVTRGEDLDILFKRIEDSGIAIVVFSSRYTESTWCLEELVKIKERAHQGHLKVLPIFYKVSPTNVKRLKEDFGDNFREQEYKYKFDESRIKRWKEAIAFVSHKFALTLHEKSYLPEPDFVDNIVKEVLKMLPVVTTVESSQSSR